jgi:hypothetical protein
MRNSSDLTHLSFGKAIGVRAEKELVGYYISSLMPIKSLNDDVILT